MNAILYSAEFVIPTEAREYRARAEWREPADANDSSKKAERHFDHDFHLLCPAVTCRFAMDHQYWVYIVASSSGTLYVGFTNNLERRMREHKSGQFEGFASTYGWDRLVYYESFQGVLRAIDREKQLKRWRRSKKIALIESSNPQWHDLAEHWGWKLAMRNESIRAEDA